MDLKQKKQQLVDEFNKNQRIIQQLTQRNQRILGALELIQEQEQKNKNKDKKK